MEMGGGATIFPFQKCYIERKQDKRDGCRNEMDLNWFWANAEGADGGIRSLDRLYAKRKRREE